MKNKNYSPWEISISEKIAELKDARFKNNDTEPSIQEVYLWLSNILPQIATFGMLPKKKWDEKGDKMENVFIFNPETSTWQSPVYFYGIVLSACGYVFGPVDITKFSNYLFERIRNARGVITIPERYSGARYLLFTNGILDLQTMKLNEIRSGKNGMGIRCYDETQKFLVNGNMVTVPEMGFTPQHLHKRKLIENPELPTFPAVAPYKEWNPHEWLLKTNGNDPEKAKYMLQLIGAMIVPNHSFNCFIEINGASSSGKTTLVSIAKNIYNGGVESGIEQNKNLSDLKDENFPFRGTVTEKTNLIQITEVNGSRLSENAVATINNFANQTAQVRLLGKKNLQLTPPPLLVLEGKGWALFDSIKTGIARRLVPLDLNDADTADYKTPVLKKNVFADEKVVTWFLWHVIVSFRELTQGNEDFIFEIDDVKNLPKFAREWHRMAINAGDPKMEHYMARIKPYLLKGYLAVPFMYELYKKSVELEGGDKDTNLKYMRGQESFRSALIMYLKDSYDVEDFDTELQKHSRDELGIDLDNISDNFNELPPQLANYSNSSYNLVQTSNWIKITKKEEVEV